LKEVSKEDTEFWATALNFNASIKKKGMRDYLAFLKSIVPSGVVLSARQTNAL
jgi:hypothetical protein